MEMFYSEVFERKICERKSHANEHFVAGNRKHYEQMGGIGNV